MIEFIKILFLSKFILLTIDPVTIDERFSINTPEPIYAVNYHAEIVIDVTNMLPNVLGLGVVKELDFIKEKFPQGCVLIELKNSNTVELVVLKKMTYSTSPTNLEISFKYPKNYKLNKVFDVVIVKPNIKLENVIIGWRNSK